jgi:hypothetical protein
MVKLYLLIDRQSIKNGFKGLDYRFKRFDITLFIKLNLLDCIIRKWRLHIIV